MPRSCYARADADSKNPELQVNVGSWRAETFRSIESTLSNSRKSELFQHVAGRIVDDWQSALKALPGMYTLSPLIHEGLNTLLHEAYEWNCAVKSDIIKYDFQPFAIEPGAKWDHERMEVFERIRRTVDSTKPIISQVSLGLNGTIALGGIRASHVQRKAGILVEEWFEGVKKTLSVATDTLSVGSGTTCVEENDAISNFSFGTLHTTDATSLISGSNRTSFISVSEADSTTPFVPSPFSPTSRRGPALWHLFTDSVEGKFRRRRQQQQQDHSQQQLPKQSEPKPKYPDDVPSPVEHHKPRSLRASVGSMLGHARRILLSALS